MFRKKAPNADQRRCHRRPSEATKRIAAGRLRRRVKLSPDQALKARTPSAAAETAASPLAPQPEPDRYGKRLIVGEGIRLSGEISSCDRLVVEGEVEVTLNDTLALEITRGGRFTGGCEVEEADISGTYGRSHRAQLRVRSGGSGTIRYAQLELGAAADRATSA
jgi:hypothetical protein